VNEEEALQVATIVDGHCDSKQLQWDAQLMADPCLRLKAAAYSGDTPHTHAKFVSTKQAMKMGLQDPEMICSVLEQCFKKLSCMGKIQEGADRLQQEHQKEVAALRQELNQGLTRLRKEQKQSADKLKLQQKTQERALESLQRKHKYELEQATSAEKPIEQSPEEIKHARMCEKVCQAHPLPEECSLPSPPVRTSLSPNARCPLPECSMPSP
jgi:hypothetical protein